MGVLLTLVLIPVCWLMPPILIARDAAVRGGAKILWVIACASSGLASLALALILLVLFYAPSESMRVESFLGGLAFGTAWLVYAVFRTKRSGAFRPRSSE